MSTLYRAARTGLQRLLPVPRRVSYLIDPRGRVARAYVVQDVAKHADAVLADLEVLVESADGSAAGTAPGDGSAIDGA